MSSGIERPLPAEHEYNKQHLMHRAGWLRAAVLGANDGLISTSSLVIGVAAAGGDVLLAGFSGVVAGAMSMAAGEYVSVSSQSDTEKADIATEAYHLEHYRELEERELAGLYERRGLSPELAEQVAQSLMTSDALGAHVREELGITEQLQARPVMAAAASFFSFIAGAIWPLWAAWLSVGGQTTWSIVVCTLVMLVFLGGIAAKIGGASVQKGAIRVLAWGALAMAVTAIAGHDFQLLFR
ncbi:Uncharacterised protein [BD1-7 clade bacterium]|uniref:Fe(2+)/Mn(2+) transporter pcl1 n=1 Tax=BD1-7 clade bacterium TaxID=2029982 RepID=A0A5S9QF21_9GAMM|nr:Uncharacterised protein [BD1-7 clade bacterium]